MKKMKKLFKDTSLLKYELLQPLQLALKNGIDKIHQQFNTI